MFPMTITISNPAQLHAVMSALNIGGIESPKATHCTSPATDTMKEEVKGKSATARKEATKPEVNGAAKSEAPVAATVQQTPETLTQMTASEAVKALDGHANHPVDAPTYQETADAVTKLGRTKGRDAALAVLKKFGVSKLPEVAPEQFAAVIAACKAAGVQ